MDTEGKSWEIWMQDLGTKAQNTRQAYTRNFRKFLYRWELTPDELYEMRSNDIKSDDPRDHLNIERMVKTHMTEVRQEGLSVSSSDMIRKAVQSFFESQNLELKFKAKDLPKGIHNGQRAVTTKQIADMYDNMVFRYKLRNRAILLSLKDTGLRISDLGALDVRDYMRAHTVFNDAGEPFKVFLDPEETQKMKVPAYVHFGPESVKLIDEYLQERKDNGEDLTPDRPLFITHKDTEYSREHGGRMTKNSFTGIFDRLKKWLPNQGHKLSAHSLRKFHRTRLEGAGMPEGWVKKLQGKKASVYSQPEHTGELTQKYIECYSALRIFGEQVSTQQLEEQATEIERLKAEVARYKAETDRLREEYGAFDERLERMREHFDERLDRNSKLETKVVYGEEAMVEMVNKGWDLMKEINGNRFIVKGQAVKTET